MFTEKGVRRRLYNAGDRISEVMHYSLPDGHDIHCTARYLVEAPEKEFFDVPTTIQIGDASISVQFLETILRPDRYGERGVILVNKAWESPRDADEAERMPVAATDGDAIAKGNRHWKAYIQKVAQQWIDQCQQVRAAGGVPTAASGFVVRALRLCGVIDPAQAVVITAQENKSGLSKLEEIIEKQQKQIDELLGRPGAAPKDKKAVATSTART